MTSLFDLENSTKWWHLSRFEGIVDTMDIWQIHKIYSVNYSKWERFFDVTFGLWSCNTKPFVNSHSWLIFYDFLLLEIPNGREWDTIDVNIDVVEESLF